MLLGQAQGWSRLTSRDFTGHQEQRRLFLILLGFR